MTDLAVPGGRPEAPQETPAARVAGLEAAQAGFRAIFDARHIAVLLIDPETGRIVDGNDAACAFYGYSREELTALSVTSISTRHADEIAADMAAARAGDRTTFTFTHRLASGEVRDVEVSSGRVEVGGVDLLLSIVQDVTARREESERDERIQRLYAAMAEIDHLIARANDEATLLQEGCRIAVEVGGFKMAWIGRVNETSPERLIDVVAFEGEHGGALDGLRVSARDDLPEGRGAVGRALRERRAVVVNDFAADRGTEYWHAPARAQGFRSVVAVPLRVAGRPDHVVAVYSGVVNAFGAAEVGVLERIVDDVAFRLQMLDAEVARRSAEDDLRRSEERYRALVEHAPDGIYVLDASGRFIDASPATCSILGLSMDELLGSSIVSLAPERHRKRIEAGLDGMAAPGTSHELVARYGRPDGRPIDIDIHSVRLADGRIQGIVRDVTASRAAEAERDQLAAAVEQAAESIAILDRTGRLLYVNPAFEALTGYSRREAVGQPITILRTGLLDPAAYEAIDSTVALGTRWSGRVVNRRKDGRTYELDLVCTPIRDRAGRVVGVVEVGRDTSQERALEAQLAEAQRLEAVGRLAGGVAHDFNNLLTAISGYAQLALGDVGDGASLREDIEEILRAAGRATRLTRQLLAFSRRQLLQPRVIDLATVIGGIVPMLQRLIGEDIHLAFAADGSQFVLADAGQIEQVVMNLVVNARDAMPDGGHLAIDVRRTEVGAADLAAEPTLAPGSYVRLSVADTGVGIAPDVLEHVFEPFFTTKEHGKGTGLGLAMVFGIARQSNGFVRVESSPGEGAVFSVFLPAVSEGPEETREPVGPQAAAAGSETILVVEDEPLVRSFARRVLEEHGFRVLDAGSGEEALELAARVGYALDLLFTDVVMPSVGGRELAARLLALKPGLRVLYASGYPEGSLAGAPGVSESSYLDKPYTTQDLVARVHAILEAPPPAGASPVSTPQA